MRSAPSSVIVWFVVIFCALHVAYSMDGLTTLAGSKATPVVSTIIDHAPVVIQPFRLRPAPTSPPLQRTKSSTPPSTTPLKALPSPNAPPPLLSAYKNPLSRLIHRAKQQLDSERSLLYSDATKDFVQSTENEKNRHFQDTKVLLASHAAANLLSEKISDEEHMAKRLAQLHNDRLVPCGEDNATPCATLLKISNALRIKKMELSDADTCDQLSHTSCENCTSLSFCGWCGVERSCLEGNAEGPRFGDTCSSSWSFFDGKPNSHSTCPAVSLPSDSEPAVNDIQYPDLSVVFDPACSKFAGTPGACERAKLRLEAIYIRCLSEGRTSAECDKSKQAEAEAIAHEQQLKKIEKEKLKNMNDDAAFAHDLSECIERVKRNKGENSVVGLLLLDVGAKNCENQMLRQ